MDVYSILSLTFCILVFLVTIATGILIWIRRSTFPIVQRLVFTYYLDYLAVIYYSICNALSFIQVIPCNVYAPSIYLMFVNLAGSGIIRSFHTLFKYQLAIYYGKILSKNVQLSKREKWFIQHRNFVVSWKPYFIFWAVSFLFAMFLFFIDMGVYNQFTNTDTSLYSVCTNTFGVVLYALLVVYIIIIGIVVTTLFKKLGSSSWIDSLYTIREIRIVIIIWIPIFLIWAILEFFDYNIFALIFLPEFGYLCHVIFVSGSLLYYSYGTSSVPLNFPSEPSSQEHAKTLEELLQLVLEKPELKESFRKFLEGLWCAENLVFLEEIKALHQMDTTDSEQVIKKVKHIQTIFFQNDGILNIDNSILSKLQKKLNSGNEDDLNDIHIFDECEATMKEMIKVDSLNKWQQSPHFPSALVTLDLKLNVESTL